MKSPYTEITVLSTEDNKILIKALDWARKLLLNFLTKPGLWLTWITHTGKSRPQAQWRGSKVAGQSTRVNIESVRGSQPRKSANTDRLCVKSQEKQTEIIIVIKFPFFGQSINIDSILFSIRTPISCKFCLNGLIFERRRLQFFSVHVYYQYTRRCTFSPNVT